MHVNWLTTDDPARIETTLRETGNLRDAETVTGVSRAGSGNMNLVLRVVTTHRQFILKQSRPWVEKYPTIAAPEDRILFEQRFYDLAGRDPACRALMPSLIAADPTHRILILEDLGESTDCTSLYATGDAASLTSLLESLVPWLARVHALPLTAMDREKLGNRALRQLNHAHIFEIPFAVEPALDLDAVTAGLSTVAAPLRRDSQLKSRSHELGSLYLADGPCLLHGDFYPGSWLQTNRGVRVIDPEFCFAGCAEFDLGVLQAHIQFIAAVHDQNSEAVINTLPAMYTASRSSSAPPVNWRLVEEFGAVEILRRLLGVAQLPLTLSLDQKARLVDAATSALSSSSAT